MLRQAKILTLDVLKSLGAFELFGRSNWRLKRLLILAYHGISQHDEHLWNPSLYMTPEDFRKRMQLLKDNGCNVLPLSEAIELLSAGKLPEKSVVLTFDDGFAGFYNQAFPILKSFGFPSTVYLTSFYSGFNKPVFDVMCSYLLWKGRSRTLNANGFHPDSNFDLTTEAGRTAAGLVIRTYARDQRMTASQKDRLLHSIASELKIDYDAILKQRLLHLLSPEEISELAADGVDFQLHTHRHCVPDQREFFLNELEENKEFIAKLTASSPKHFCYPSGVHDPGKFPLLSELSIASAVTCNAGLASQTSHVFALPRVTDTNSLQAVEFEGWLCGAAEFFPRRVVHDDELIYPYYY